MLGTCTSIGDTDRASAAAFGAQIYEMIDDSDEALVSVDCSGVTFMDSAGYHVLVDATKYAIRRGHTLVIRNPSHACAMLLRLCDIERELRIDALTAEHFGHRQPDAMILPTTSDSKELIGLAERMGIPTNDSVHRVLAHLTHEQLSVHVVEAGRSLQRAAEGRNARTER